jgi:hypothetical protein
MKKVECKNIYMGIENHALVRNKYYIMANNELKSNVYGRLHFNKELGILSHPLQI